MSGHHGPPDLDAQKDAQRPFTTDPHSPLGPLLPPPGGRHQERPHPGSPTPSPTPGHPPWVSHPVTHPITPSGSPTPGRPPRVTHPVTHPITHPRSPTPSPPLGHPPWVSHVTHLITHPVIHLITHPGSPALGDSTRRDSTPGHPPWAAPSCQLGRCPVASLKLRGEEPGQEVASGTHTHWACRARLHVPHGSTCPTAARAPRPVLATGVRPGPRGSTAHDLLVSHGARRPRGPGGLGKAGGRRGIWWSWVPAVGGGHADPRPAQ